MTATIDLERVTAHPLTWPFGWPRTRTPGPSRFKGHSMIDSISEVYAQLKRMGVGDWNVVISSNVALRLDGLPRSGQRRPDDPGVAVYFRFKGKPHALACDKWNTPEDNLWAISKHIEALRGQDRWGVGTLEQAFTGYAALPEPKGDAWWLVLGFEHEPQTFGDVKTRYRELSLKLHPDKTGDDTEFKRVASAYEEAKLAFGV